ncbi:MAG TPA: 5'-nucleotidase C-terminal domain-containing protein [Thermoanaerobaculia bacterium]|nr:5'-nucleotidase C-terminal domain-containing protein [Thermoanaerobaculia bacterium]
MITRLTLLLVLAAGSLRAGTAVTLLHFSDYHSHAVPFYSEGTEKGGFARALGFMERHKRAGALVFNGGDMMNKGAPAWSDKYRCAEWAWLNGVVDAMAFGNHDPDYGNGELTRCRAEVRYPILSANTVGFERYRVFERKGVRIGVFAVAGSDFPRLVTAAKLTFTDPIAAARDVVQTLREREHVDAVVMIGHEHAEDDYRLAAAVPGIDVILGSHTHLEQELTRIPGTQTWFISPYQYLTYISVVDLTFDGHKLSGVDGRLVPVDSTMKPDRRMARRIAAMQRDLERDPQYRELFVPIARLPKPMDVRDLAQFTVETMRESARADFAMSTASSFRQALPAGPVDLETLRAALPYDNEIVIVPMAGSTLMKLLARSAEGTSDGALFVTPLAAVDPDRTYRVAVTDYMAFVSSSYRDLAASPEAARSGFRVRAAVMKRMSSQWPSAP